MASAKLHLLVRSFSTSTLQQQLVKPPVQLFGIDGRYATALYSAATKQKALDAVEKDLIKFQTSIKSDPKLKEFMINPTIQRLQKAQVLKVYAEKAALTSQTSNLLQALAENGRLQNLDGIIEGFKYLMSAHRGEVVCEVTTATILDAKQSEQLNAVLKSFLKGSQTLHLTTKVDPSIIGGMIVSIGDRYVDMSVSSKIKKYTELITITI